MDQVQNLESFACQMVGVARCYVIDNCAVCPFFAVKFAADPPVSGNDVGLPARMRSKLARSTVVSRAGFRTVGMDHVTEY